MIGIDAADCVFIEDHVADLPHIAALAGPGGLHRLTVEPLSGAVWTTFMTGMRPDHHGVYHHMQWDPASMTLRRTHPDWIGAIEPFWRDWARSGLRVTAFDVPFVFPGDTGGATEIANWGSHDLVDRFWASDPATEAKVRAVADTHPMGFEVPVQKSRNVLQKALDGVLAGIPLKTAACLRLMETTPTDAFIVIFGEAHRAGHLLWPDDDGPGVVPPGALLSVYKALDTAVAELIDKVGTEANIVLFALHGMARNQSQSHFSADMLALAEAEIAGVPRPSGFGLIRTLRRTVPAPLQLTVANMVPTAVRDFVLAREIAGGHSWDRTKAISSDGDVSGYWRGNIAGREAKGALAPEDPFFDSFAEVLHKFTDAQGTPMVERITRPTRDWTGPRAHLLPDMVAEWTPSLPSLRTAHYPGGRRLRGQLATGRSGNHRFHGFLAGRFPEHGPLPDHIKEIGNWAHGLVRR